MLYVDRAPHFPVLDVGMACRVSEIEWLLLVSYLVSKG